MDAKELKALSIDLMDAVRQRNLSAFSLKCEDFQIRIEAQQAPVAVAAPAVAVAAPAAAGSTTGTARSRFSGRGILLWYAG